MEPAPGVAAGGSQRLPAPSLPNHLQQQQQQQTQPAAGRGGRHSAAPAVYPTRRSVRNVSALQDLTPALHAHVLGLLDPASQLALMRCSRGMWQTGLAHSDAVRLKLPEEARQVPARRAAVINGLLLFPPGSGPIKRLAVGILGKSRAGQLPILPGLKLLQEGPNVAALQLSTIHTLGPSLAPCFYHLKELVLEKACLDGQLFSQLAASCTQLSRISLRRLTAACGDLSACINPLAGMACLQELELQDMAFEPAPGLLPRITAIQGTGHPGKAMSESMQAAWCRVVCKEAQGLTSLHTLLIGSQALPWATVTALSALTELHVTSVEPPPASAHGAAMDLTVSRLPPKMRALQLGGSVSPHQRGLGCLFQVPLLCRLRLYNMTFADGAPFQLLAENCPKLRKFVCSSLSVPEGVSPHGFLAPLAGLAQLGTIHATNMPCAWFEDESLALLKKLTHVVLTPPAEDGPGDEQEEAAADAAAQQQAWHGLLSRHAEEGTGGFSCLRELLLNPFAGALSWRTFCSLTSIEHLEVRGIEAPTDEGMEGNGEAGAPASLKKIRISMRTKGMQRLSFLSLVDEVKLGSLCLSALCTGEGQVATGADLNEIARLGCVLGAVKQCTSADACPAMLSRAVAGQALPAHSFIGELCLTIELPEVDTGGRNTAAVLSRLLPPMEKHLTAVGFSAAQDQMRMFFALLFGPPAFFITPPVVEAMGRSPMRTQTRYMYIRDYVFAGFKEPEEKGAASKRKGRGGKAAGGKAAEVEEEPASSLVARLAYEALLRALPQLEVLLLYSIMGAEVMRVRELAQAVEGLGRRLTVQLPPSIFKQKARELEHMGGGFLTVDIRAFPH